MQSGELLFLSSFGLVYFSSICKNEKDKDFNHSNKSRITFFFFRVLIVYL